LPSSVLMTVATARAAGVIDVTLATPNVSAVMLAAAEIAGATRVLHCGGAQAIAALAFGVAGEAERLPAADVIVGPGNRYVTEAKRLLSGRVGIDMLAGPSEVLIVAVPEAGYAVDAGVIAADMLAQAEHDADAAAILVTTDAGLVDRVEIQLGLQLADLPTAVTARQAIANSFAVVCASRAECLDVAGRLAPEHLELFTADAAGDLGNVTSYGGAFVGSASAEVFGDYGVGPNHTLPTSGVARFSAGLSVMHFVRARTWLRMDRGHAGTAVRDAYQAMCRETAIFARAEGLEAHARAAEIRASGRR